MTTSRTERIATDAGVAGLRRWGDGEPDVVLLHGAGGNRDSLAPLGDALARRGLSVVALSMPGRVGSDGDAFPSLRVAATWLAAVLAVVAPHGTVLLGHSMGGGIAIETALTTGARLGGLALVATGARLRVHPTILSACEQAVADEASAAAISAAGARPDGPPSARSHLLTVEALTPAPIVQADWQATDRFDRLYDVAELDLPVLVVAGDLDHLTPPKYAHHLADTCPSAELVMLPEAGHWLPVERAEEVAGAVAAFVARLG